MSILRAFSRLADLAHRFRRFGSVVAHLGLAALSNYLAFQLRFDADVPFPQAPLVVQMLPWLLLIRGAVFVPLRLYEGLWRYTSIWDLRNIIVGVLSSTVIFYFVVHVIFGATVYSRSIFVIDSILLICFMGGLRLTRRIYREVWRREGHKRVLVVGAGDAGAAIVRDMLSPDMHDYEPIGFIDDDRQKVGQRIIGVPVLGTRDDLRRVLAEKQPQEILIAIPTADAQTLRAIVKSLEPFKIRITTLPSLRNILDGRVTVEQIRHLEPEDLLARAPIGLDPEPIRRLIRGRRVLVTGAGGSIGSELCRQIAALEPAVLVLYERYENSLFAIASDLADQGHGGHVVSVIGDITDPSRLTATFHEHRPEIVFHAAAHKHVPLMEQNPCEAIKNNVLGTRLVVETSHRYGVKRFILISTDKAVRPISVMGATKRIAELMLQAFPDTSSTAFLTVRFGNVLASNGSVIPRFLKQIRAGGPVTVTHPEMKRYFMLISEAVQLVLHAAAAGENRAIYLLNMGEPIKLVDMARTLIRLAGFLPDEEVPITFVGMRPGEKLEEELIGPSEVIETSIQGHMFKVRPGNLGEKKIFREQLASLEQHALQGETREVLDQLVSVIPTFGNPDLDQPQPIPALTFAPPTERMLPAGQACPKCHSSVYRSHAHNLVEQARRSLSEKRLFRCRACGWRGWMLPVEEPVPSLPFRPASIPDLHALDASLNAAPPASDSISFSVRDLG